MGGVELSLCEKCGKRHRNNPFKTCLVCLTNMRSKANEKGWRTRKRMALLRNRREGGRLDARNAPIGGASTNSAMREKKSWHDAGSIAEAGRGGDNGSQTTQG